MRAPLVVVTVLLIAAITLLSAISVTVPDVFLGAVLPLIGAVAGATIPNSITPGNGRKGVSDAQ